MLQLFLEVPTVKLIPLLFGLLVALADIRADKKRKTRWRKVAVPIILASSAFASGWIICADAFDAKDKAIQTAKLEREAERWRMSTGTQLDRIEGERGVEAATERYLQGVRQLNSQYLEDKTGAAADKFFSSQGERVQLREQARQLNEKLATRERVRYEPIYYFATSKFDRWIVELKKHGIAVETTEEEPPAVVIGNSGYWRTSRIAKFQNKTSIDMQIIPTGVEDGQVKDTFTIMLAGTKHDDIGGESWVIVKVTSERISVRNIKPARFIFRDYDAICKAPIEDEKVTRLLNAAFDEVMTYIAEEATLTK